MCDNFCKSNYEHKIKYFKWNYIASLHPFNNSINNCLSITKTMFCDLAILSMGSQCPLLKFLTPLLLFPIFITTILTPPPNQFNFSDFSNFFCTAPFTI